MATIRSSACTHSLAAVGASYPVRYYTRRISDDPYATSQGAGCSQCTTYAHLRGHQTSKHWGGDSIIGICDKNGMRDVCRV